MKKIKTRFLCYVLALVCVLTAFQPMSVKAADYSSGGWNQVMTNTSVVDGNGNYVGTVFAGDGVTVFYVSGDTAYIEYSAGSSYKRGYVNKSIFSYFGGRYPGSAVGLVTSSTNAYYSPSTTFYAGAVNTGEYVAILCRSGGWDYIEYNISNGLRKRAFVPSSAIAAYSTPRSSFYQSGSGINFTANSTITVYSGPNANTYGTVGQIFAKDVVSIYATFSDGVGGSMVYISYPAGNGYKYGYIYR